MGGISMEGDTKYTLDTHVDEFQVQFPVAFVNPLISNSSFHLGCACAKA